MLPERLSNGLCSLNPDVDRLCMVCDMSIGPAARSARYRFYPAVMRSHARLTYTEVGGACESERRVGARLKGCCRACSSSISSSVPCSRRARSAARSTSRRSRRSSSSTRTTGCCASYRVERNDAHRLIEECMLAANVCASDFLSSREHPVLYRVHDGPTPEKLKALREFLEGIRPAACAAATSRTREGLREAARDGAQAPRRRSCCRPCCCAR